MRIPVILRCVAVFAVVQGPAHALTPAEVFEKVAPSVWAVRGLDGEKRPLSFGSGVVIGPGTIVTNCHILAKARSIEVRRDKLSHAATLEHPDAERDLCILRVPGLAAPAVEIADLSSLRVGSRAYVVGNPERLALTLSEGMISGLGSDDARLPPIQTSAPMSPGLSGGGLFDELGRLVGVTTLSVVGRERLAQNLNFALPAEWIREVPARAKAQLAQRAEQHTNRGSPPAAEPNRPPAVGATWKYSFREQKYGVEDVFTVQVTGVSGWMIDEALSSRTTELKNTVNAQEAHFSSKPLGAGHRVLEFAPYLVAANGGEPPARLIPARHPASGSPFRIRVERVQREDVEVYAGSFKTVRIDIRGERASDRRQQRVTRFRHTTWYAPEIGRYVKVHHQQWDGGGALTSDEVVQLMDYRSN